MTRVSSNIAALWENERLARLYLNNLEEEL
jgi:hypothetical protein